MRKKSEQRQTTKLDSTKRVKGLTPNHNIYLRCIREADVTICTSPAGTGKTYMAAGVAAELLSERKVQRLIISRPMVLCGNQKFGSVPGTVEEKMAGFVEPIVDALGSFLGGINTVNKLIKEQAIRVIPLEYLRGHDIKNTFVLVDEAQNATLEQLKMLFTRLSDGSKLVVVGDITQQDLSPDVVSPLLEIINRCVVDCHPKMQIVRMTNADCVRHGFVKWFCERISGPQTAVEHPCTKPPAETEPDAEEFFCDCPSCEAENISDLVSGKDPEQVQCWNCETVIEIPEFEEMEPYVAAVKTDACIPGRKGVTRG